MLYKIVFGKFICFSYLISDERQCVFFKYMYLYSFEVKCAGNYNVPNFRQSSCEDAADYGQFGKLQVIYDVIGCYLEVAACQWQARCSRRCAALVGSCDKTWQIKKSQVFTCHLHTHWALI